MLQNFSQRERILALAAGTLVPVALLGAALFWFLRTLDAYDASIAGLNRQLNQARTLQTRQVVMTRRGGEYRQQSLPADPQRASTEYRRWLGELTERVFGANQYTIESIRQTTVQSKIRDRNQPTRSPKTIYRQLATNVIVPTCTLGQLDRFLVEFYATPILHRVGKLTVTPIVGRPGTNTANLPTGRLALIIAVEGLALADAPQEQAVPPAPLIAARAEELALRCEAIEQRNIFGLPNNAPEITTAAQSEYEGRDVSFAVSARDADTSDEMKFELVESNIPEGTLNPSSSGRSAQFKSPPLSVGNYVAKIRVTDSGFPPKSHEKEIALEIRTPPAPPPPEPEPPPFLHAREAVVTAIVREKDGSDRAWIYVRTLGLRHLLAVGDSFQLDDETWYVTAINPRSVQLRVKGETRSYRIGDRLDQPRARSRVETSSAAPLSGGQP